MSLTLEEIKERLLRLYDPDDLLEALQISAEELLDRFEDKFIRRLDEFQEELEEEEYAE
jgi:sugar-specific transcriptional regulator TrmB